MRAEKIFQLAKGFRGRAKNTIRTARNRVEKALQYMYRDRKVRPIISNPKFLEC
jgi:large subunit ribosomal protein L20